jgi:hypothetical protein
MRYSRISADCHIDMPWIPDDLFTANATAAMRDRMPYVTDGPDGPFWTCKNGMSFGLVGGVGPGGAKLVPGQNYRVDKMAAVGLSRTARRASAGRLTPTCASRTWSSMACRPRSSSASWAPPPA